ncbi:MAG: MinD/ParA family protein [Spirochaetes bacterium]|nr:MinD/ParA family protein [Spirochaetota bacterium]
MTTNNVMLYRKKAKHAQIITVSGGKGGVGKTFFSVNFAVELKNRGYKVLIFDADINLSNVNLLLHIDENNRFKDYLKGKLTLPEIIQKGVAGVDVLYVGEDMDKILEISSDQLTTLVKELKKLESIYDFIIIDTSAGINEMNLKLMAKSDRVVMIANPEITSLVDLYRVIKITSKKKPHTHFEIIINRTLHPDSAARIYKKIAETISMFKIKTSVSFLGYMLEDPRRVLESIQKRIPYIILHENGQIGGCIKLIVNSFLRNKKPVRKFSFFHSLIEGF